jgi:signal transduction histidine kinase
MRLSQFILTHTEEILSEWEAFARSIVPSGMDIVGLRDHAREMLEVIARDLETPQTPRQESDKSKGRSDADPDPSTPDTPAQAHGSGRAESGFTFEQMVSEYRAMRASVIRLWTVETGELKGSDIEDLIRFSEAIDQALAESTSRFTADLDYTKETFLGILGHDLRTPLGAIVTSAQFMLEVADLKPPADTLMPRIVSSGMRMSRMVDDLLDFVRGRLDGSIPIVRRDVDLRGVLEEAIGEIRGSRPDATVFFETSGDLRGEWDSARLSQVLSNLLSNAVSHGSADTPITVRARGEADEVVLSVHNRGRPIRKDQLPLLFDPMKRKSAAARDSDHLGLGLYITERVVSGHGGRIEVESNDERGTTFVVRLPRQQPE